MSPQTQQLGLYVRYIALEEGKIMEEFLELKRVIGHPTADNLFSTVMKEIEKGGKMKNYLLRGLLD